MTLVVKQRETRPKKSRGVDWSRDIIVLARVGKKELWWVRGIAISRGSVFSREYINARLMMVPDAEKLWEGKDYKSTDVFEGGRLSKARFIEHAGKIDSFFGIPGLASMLESGKTVVEEEDADSKKAGGGKADAR